MTAIRSMSAVLACLAIAGCATPTAQPPVSGETFQVPFAYAAFGAGPQPELGQVSLVEGNEPAQVGDAITFALQALGLSVVAPPPQAARGLPPGTRWSTDVAPLSADDIAEYNRRFPASALPRDRYYGIQYAGEYAIVQRTLRFRLESILHQRGSAGDFRKYDAAPYASEFFFDRMRARLVTTLSAKDAP